MASLDGLVRLGEDFVAHTATPVTLFLLQPHPQTTLDALDPVVVVKAGDQARSQNSTGAKGLSEDAESTRKVRASDSGAFCCKQNCHSTQLTPSAPEESIYTIVVVKCPHLQGLPQ